METVLNRLAGRWALSLTGIVLIGFALRCLWALAVPVEPISDSVAYHTFARTIVEHGVYGWSADEPGAFWAVGTSGLLAGIYWLFGMDFGAVAAVNVALSTSLIASTGLLARHLLGAPAGLIAALLIALWPSLILFTTIIASEVTFLALIVPGMLAFLHRWKRPWLGWLIAGLFWGAACYVRPVALLLPIVLAVSCLLRGRWTIWYGLAAMVGTLVVMALLIAPWTARNQAVFGKTVLISTNFGPNLWMGNNPETTGGYQALPDWTDGLSETELADRMKAEAVAYIKAEPVAFAIRTLVKFARLHERETIGVVWN
ncbi:MAG: glycosyl transferase family 39, partial [Pseudomonadota bacterium]